jgi:hypothetical protein
MRPDKSLIYTETETPYAINAAESDRVSRSLRVNGVAVLRGFVPTFDIDDMRQAADAATTEGFNLPKAAACAISPSGNGSTLDFRHPFLVSGAAARLATSQALLDIVEGGIGSKAVVHHAIFQRSLVGNFEALDWHIDCGSNKLLNGLRKFPDKRIRMILYLSDVSSGGFSYIVGTPEAALKSFYPLPIGELFPPDQVPSDDAQKITFNDKVGTLILFDTHGLHRPEMPKSERLVLNIWFARSDFSGKLPPTLVSVSLVPPENRDRIYVFDNQRGFDPLEAPARPDAPPSLARRIAKRILGR